MDLVNFSPLLILAGPGPGSILWPDERGWPRWLNGDTNDLEVGPLFPAQPTALTAAVAGDGAIHLGLWEEQGGWYRGPASGWQSLPSEIGSLRRPRLLTIADGLHLLGDGPGRQLQHWRHLSGTWHLERTWGPARWEAAGNSKLGLALILGGDRLGQYWRWERDMWEASGLTDLPSGEPVALLAAGETLDLAWLAKGKLLSTAYEAGAWGPVLSLGGDVVLADQVYLWHAGQRRAVQWGRPSGGFFVRYSENNGASWSAALHRPEAGWERPLRVIYGSDYPGPYAQAVNWPSKKPPPLRPSDLAQAIWPTQTREIRAASQPTARPAGPPSYFVALDERIRRLEARASRPPERSLPPPPAPWWRRLWHPDRNKG